MLLGIDPRAQAAPKPKVTTYVDGQIVVELRPTTKIGKVNTDYRTRTRDDSLASNNFYLLDLPTDMSVKEADRRMSGDARLVNTEPNFITQPTEGVGRHRAFGVSDAEPSPQEDAASALNLSIAHDVSLGKGVTVAVLDTGAQLDHPALKANFEGVDRYDFVDDDPDPSDSPVGKDEDGNGLEDQLVGHGTHVAGIVDLVAPNAKIMPLRVLDTDGYGEDFEIAKAIYFATNNGADVINLSLGTPSRTKLLRNVIKDATKKGVLVAAAAGNLNSSKPYYPAAGNDGEDAVNGLVAVTSVSIYGQKSDFANYGSWVDVAAPGEGIRSALPVSKYANWSGTSMATPFVSGQAALIHAVYGSLSPAGIEEKIRCSSRPLFMTDPVYAAELGAGHTDVGTSLTPGACDTTAPPQTTITASTWGLINNTSAAFAFSASKTGTSFECKLDGSPFTACSSPKRYTDLPDGQHTFEVRSTDAAGNTDSTPASRTWSVDTTAPNAPVIDSPAGNSRPNTGDITVSGTAEANSTVELFEGSDYKGMAIAGAEGHWSITLTGVADGEHSYAVRATDAAGNTSAASEAVSVTVDTAAPAVTGVTPQDGTTGVAPAGNAEATFSEVMDPATLNQNTFTLVEQGSVQPLEATITYDVATKKATLNSDTDLQANATYTATVNTGAKDVAGNPLVTDKVWSFTTAVPVF